MTINQHLVEHGTADSKSILADLAFIDGDLVNALVQLTADYETTRAPGALSRPGMTGAAAEHLDYPRTIASGTVLALHKPEAEALVAAGRAIYV